MADHIVPHRGDRELFWNLQKWQPLCKDCHDRKTGSGMQLVSVMTLFLPQERHEEWHGVALSMPPIKQFPYTYSRQMDHMLAVLLHTGSDERVNGLRSQLSVFAFKDADQTETRHGLLVRRLIEKTDRRVLIIRSESVIIF